MFHKICYRFKTKRCMSKSRVGENVAEKTRLFRLKILIVAEKLYYTKRSL